MFCYHRRFTTRLVIVALAAVAIAVAPSLTCVDASTVSASWTRTLAATQQQQQKGTSSSMAFAKRTKGGPSYLSFLDDVNDNKGDVFNAMGSSNSRRHQGHGNKIMQVQECSTPAPASLAKNIVRGAFLRIASDLSGGTPLESIKCRVTVTQDNMVQAYQNIVKEGGFWSLWAGTPSRTVEGALLGAFFMVGSTLTKRRVLAMGGSKTLAALAGGTVGGVAQAVVMTPAGMIFTSLNVNRGKKGYENDNALTVARRIIKEKGLKGMFYGGGPMCLRQASNWASRAGFTEIARTNLRMSQFGVWGEIWSGVIGGVGSCWNTPIETIRVLMQRDVSMGKSSKGLGDYWNYIVEEQGYPGLFRGVTPRAIQAIWQTVFMVVVPNMLGI